MTIDPIHQFRIQNLVPIITIHGRQIAFTNSALFMLIIVVLVSALLIGATAPRAVVPGRLLSVCADRSPWVRLAFTLQPDDLTTAVKTLATV